ncbi:SRPBCC family protein [Cellulomonas carbonis]|nr:SRPBCC family protein [Cellulomonas carbonis]
MPRRILRMGVSWLGPCEEAVVARYRFRSSWHVTAPPPEVWRAVVAVEDWPRWWPAVSSTRVVDPGAPDGTERVVEYGLRAPLGYRLAVRTRTVDVVPGRSVLVEVLGHLDGRGRWTLTGEPGGTEVDQLWEVDTTRPWMRALAPFAAPAFRWSHDRAARRGGEGLEAWLTRR